MVLGQTDEFVSNVLNSSSKNSDVEKVVPSELAKHILEFQQSDSFRKTVILYLIDHKKYRIDSIASIFDCSRYLVKKSISQNYNGNWIFH